MVINSVIVEPSAGVIVPPLPMSLKSNAQGLSSFIIKSRKAELKSIKVELEGVALEGQIDYQPLEPATITVAADKFELAVGQKAKITAIVQDKYRNPIKDALVSMAAISEAGVSENLTPVINNDDGSYIVEYSSKLPNPVRGFATIKATEAKTGVIGSTFIEGVNSPPLLSFEPEAPYSVIDEGQTFKVVVKAADQDGDKVALSYSPKVASSNFDPVSGGFVFTPSHHQAHRQRIVFVADDGRKGGQVSKELLIPANGRPDFIVIGGQLPTSDPDIPLKFSLDEGQELAILVFADDLNGDVISYLAENLPLGAQMVGLVLSWKPGFQTVSSLEKSKRFEISLKASDGRLTAAQKIEVMVNDISSAQTTQLALTSKAEASISDFPWDVNRDGEVDIFDLILVVNHLGAAGRSPLQAQDNPDANLDGTVDIFDLILVGSHFGERIQMAAPAYDRDYMATGCAPLRAKPLEGEGYNLSLLLKLSGLLKSIPDLNHGIAKAIAELETLIASARSKLTTLPLETKLFANYPNPFNPETWIPYQLSKTSNVEVKIYDVKGRLVRHLRLGYKEAGVYVSQGQAAYWDGRNERGEAVASGMYFYQLQAGRFSYVRKMLLLK